MEENFIQKLSLYKVACLYQSSPPPAVDGVIKPMKPEGYSDSSADIIYSLKKSGLKVITPVVNPNPHNHKEWSFPDNEQNLRILIEDHKANLIWLNTILYKTHPICKYLHKKKVLFVGQDPLCVDKFDDKFYTNLMLRKNGISIARSIKFNSENKANFNQYFLEKKGLKFPLVIKPIRGRGSYGVRAIFSLEEGLEHLEKIKEAGIYFIIEEFLSGDEITITVMPPGEYLIRNRLQKKDSHWCLPPVLRFNHIDNIAPYNGVVAVTQNSSLYKNQSSTVYDCLENCKKAAALLNTKAPIRIDCRADSNGQFYLFDLNLKPNMTGEGRPNREKMNSLTAIAAEAIEWNYDQLIINILNQAW